MQKLLIALAVALAVTLGVLIFSAGTTAEVTVPLAVGEAVGVSGMILTMDTALAAAYSALQGLITSFGIVNTLGVFTATLGIAEWLEHNLGSTIQVVMSIVELS